jgi:heme exporter protein D
VSVGESSDDNLRSARPEPFVPAEAWIEAFDTQCTEETLKRLRRYALLLAKLPGGEHMGDHASYAEELVQAAVTDLVAGVLRWDPSVKDLEPYLTDVLRLRVRRDRKRAAQFKHVSIDAASPSDPGASIREVEMRLAVSASARADETEMSSSDSMTRSMRRLREFFSDDPLAQRFLAAIEQDEQDAFTRAEIMKVAGLTRAEYHNTRRRIARFLARSDRGQRMPAKDN